MVGHHPQGAFGQAILDHGGKFSKRTDISLEYLLTA
jgi:hypothetical protein